MSKYIRVEFSPDRSLYLRSIGMESEAALAHWGPGVRDCYILHYVLDGTGFFNGSEVRKNQGFLICPGEIHEYHASETDPWKYFWLIFNGNELEYLLSSVGLSSKPSIFSFLFESKLKRLINVIFENPMNDMSCLLSKGIFYTILSFHDLEKPLQSNAGQQNRHVQDAIAYMKTNYCKNIRITDIAEQLYINDRYLHNIFRKIKGESPKEYLNHLRIRKACELLKNNMLSISEIAASVGYDNSLQFSRFFSRHLGISPKKYRETPVVS